MPSPVEPECTIALNIFLLMKDSHTPLYILQLTIKSLTRVTFFLVILVITSFYFFCYFFVS